MREQKNRIEYQKPKIKYKTNIQNTAVQQGIAVFFYSTYFCLFPPPFSITYIFLYKSVLTIRSVCFFFCIRSPPCNLIFRKKLRKLDRENGLLSIDSFEKADGSGVGYLADTAADMAGKVMDQLLLDKLRECISLLSPEEQKLIHQHYYDEVSEVDMSREYGISQQAVSKRLKKVREKLKNLLEQ